jgi:hypothetical protein
LFGYVLFHHRRNLRHVALSSAVSSSRVLSGSCRMVRSKPRLQFAAYDLARSFVAFFGAQCSHPQHLQRWVRAAFRPGASPVKMPSPQRHIALCLRFRPGVLLTPAGLFHAMGRLVFLPRGGLCRSPPRARFASRGVLSRRTISSVIPVRSSHRLRFSRGSDSRFAELKELSSKTARIRAVETGCSPPLRRQGFAANAAHERRCAPALTARRRPLASFCVAWARSFAGRTAVKP